MERPNAVGPAVRELPASLHWLAPLVVDDLCRVGGSGDGGYVLPRSMLTRSNALLSMGVGPSWEFERQFHGLRPHAPIHAYDHTVSARLFRRRASLDGLAVLTGKVPLRRWRESRRIAADFERFYRTDARHFRQRITDRMQTPLDADIPTVLDRIGGSGILVKMDIEGSEYRVLRPLMAHAGRLSGLLVEFHDTAHLRPVFERDVRAVLEHFEIVHLHANNFTPAAEDGLPEALEITFAPRATVSGTQRRSRLPLPGLDEANAPDRPDYALAFA